MVKIICKEAKTTITSDALKVEALRQEISQFFVSRNRLFTFLNIFI